MEVKCIVPIEKFRDYVLMPGADGGKYQVFAGIGYSQEHAEQLVAIYEEQAADQYLQGNFSLGKKDHCGQRVTIEIVLERVLLNSRGEQSILKSYLLSGWMIVDAQTIKLNTPFAGFSRPREQSND